MNIEMVSRVWPEWQVEGAPLGRGSFGVVYKAVRRDHNVESFAAIKVISIPADQSEVDSLRSEGLDMNATRTYLQGVVDDFVSEIQLMESLKGVQNIVSVEDYKVVEKTDGVGWDIFIRMELLTSFNSYICDKKMTEEEVIKLGCDICTALEICAKRNIIHRDIKPENIFINDFGDFKLGDFGIARKLENMTGGLSQKGTYNYMAPDVVKGTEYDARVDIYSLGVVLYRMLNGNRLPFIDGEKQLLNPNEKRNAIDRRLRGEALPVPSEASPAMADLILRACAYEPDERFASAAEMKQALLDVANGTYQISADSADRTTAVRRAVDDDDKTTSVRRAPADAEKKTTIGVETFDAKPKNKRKIPTAIIAVLVAVVLVGAGAFIVPKVIHDSKDNEQITSIINDADALAAKKDYDGALTKVQNGLADYPKSADLQNKAEEYTKALHEQIKSDAIDSADKLVANEDYIGAVKEINAAIAAIGEDAELKRIAETYENMYVADVVTQVDECINTREYDAADQLIAETLKHFPNNKTAKEQQARIKNVRPQNFIEICQPYESEGYSAPTSFQMNGKSYANGFVLSGTDYNGNYALFNLEGKYSYMEFDLGHIDGDNMYDGAYNIYLDGKYSETIQISAESMVTHFEINLNNANQLKIVVCHPNTYIWDVGYGFANVTVR